MTAFVAVGAITWATSGQKKAQKDKAARPNLKVRCYLKVRLSLYMTLEWLEPSKECVNATETTFGQGSTDWATVQKPLRAGGRRVKFTFNPISIHNAKNIIQTPFQIKVHVLHEKFSLMKLQRPLVGEN